MENWRRNTPSNSPPDAPGDKPPFALVAEGPHGFTLAALDAVARKGPLKLGQRLTDARAICPELVVEPADTEADERRLRHLTLWAQRWCPWTATCGTDAMLLDVTGATHLVGGEMTMLDDMARRLRALGHRTRVAVAPSVGAAWALSHFSRGPRTVADPDTLAAALAPIGVAGLRLGPTTVLLLQRLGLKTIGALAAVPRLPLARRFAKEATEANPLIRLDQAMGRLEEPIAPLLADPPPRIVRRLTEPVTHLPILTTLIAEMVDALCAALELRQLGVRALVIDHFLVDGGIETVRAETARATRDSAHLIRLIGERLDGLDAGFGFDAVAVTAIRHEPLRGAQDHLLDDAPQGAALSHLVDRLSAKLGSGHVRRPVPVQSHIPERSLRWEPALGSPAKAGVQLLQLREAGSRPSPGNKVLTHHRPIRLLDRPEEISVLYATPEGSPRRFIWRRMSHVIARVEGPERIAPEWWREKSTVRLRDYYRVEDEVGRRYWLYRDGVDGDGRGGLPLWYLHGLFA